MIVRPATEADLHAVSAVTTEAYVDDGLVSRVSPYVEELANAKARFIDGGLLVAEDEGRVIGATSFVLHGSPYAEITAPGEALFRMLAVSPATRGSGVGLALVQACISLAYANDCTTMRLSTQPNMTAAHRLYERLGFRRTPERDWSPLPGVDLLTYELDLHAFADGGNELEPPRYCGACGRRMVVQVIPQGWTARCSVHGVRRS